MITLTIENSSDIGPIDYTRYLIPESVVVQDSINVPTLLTFTLVNIDNQFVPPVRSAYCRLYSGKFGVPIATGFITAAPSLTFLGVAPLPAFGNQRYSYDIQVTSDEWLLNVKTVPFLPPFVNKGQGQILAQLANVLVPNFFDTTSFVASGDLVPYWPYDPTVNWADLAKQFADGSRFRYKVVDRKIYFTEYGDQPLGVTYNETLGERTFYPNLLQTPVQSVPPCNDAIVIGDIEAQDNHDDYFVGDGITGTFNLRHQVFEGASSILIQEAWASDSINTSLWTVEDPTFMVSEQGGGLQLDAVDTGGGTPLGDTYVIGNQGIELGGAVNIQAGDFQFVDVCQGLVGGLYQTIADDDTLPGGTNCIAAFELSGTSVIPSASGAIGVMMQPFLQGQAVGPIVTSQQNHSYFLQMYLSCPTWSRYDRPYRTLVGEVFGDVLYAGIGQITWLIADTSVDFPNNPTFTIFSMTGVSLPEFCVFAPINAGNLNLAVSNTLVGLPPQGGLFVRSLYGPTANQFPIFPPGQEIQYLLGSGMQYQIATIAGGVSQSTGVSLPGDTQALEFYASSYQTLQGSTLPAVGSRIRLQTWEAGYSMARVQDPVAIAAEAKIVGDDGHRTAVFRQLNPLPRTSTECDAAGAAVIKDREGIQYEGTYTFNDYFLDGSAWLNTWALTGTLPASGYPCPGRYLMVTSPVRGISGLPLLVSRVTIRVTELRQEILQLVVDYGPDYYLDKTLQNFVEFRGNVLTPTDTANPPTPQQLEEVGEFYLPNLDNCRIVGTLNGYTCVVDLGQVPATGVEVRRADFGWTHPGPLLLKTVTTRYFCMPRKANEEIYYLRQVNGGLYSRFSKVLRLVYPLVPQPPPSVLIDFSVVTAPVITVNLPLNVDRNIYGVQIDNGGTLINSTVTLASDSATDFRTAVVVGYDATGNPLAETIALNGTTPVTTVGVFALLESVQILKDCTGTYLES